MFMRGNRVAHSPSQLANFDSVLTIEKLCPHRTLYSGTKTASNHVSVYPIPAGHSSRGTVGFILHHRLQLIDSQLSFRFPFGFLVHDG